MMLPVILLTASLFLSSPMFVGQHSSVVHTAQQYIGYGEYNNPKVIEKFMEQQGQGHYNIKQGAWCAIFLNSVLHANGINGTHSLMARSFLNWGHKTVSPQIGDIVVFKDLTKAHNPNSGHVGIFMGFQGSYVLSLGGNEDKRVEIKAYPRSYIVEYRRY